MELIDSDDEGKSDFSARRGADLKPSERAKVSGDARNEAIKVRMAERRAAEEEAARKAEEEKAARDAAARDENPENIGNPEKNPGDKPEEDNKDS